MSQTMGEMRRQAEVARLGGGQGETSTPFLQELKAQQSHDVRALEKVLPGYEMPQDAVAALFLANRAERRHLAALESVRAWQFWGPFWAIVASGAVAGVLYFAAGTVLLASQR